MIYFHSHLFSLLPVWTTYINLGYELSLHVIKESQFLTSGKERVSCVKNVNPPISYYAIIARPSNVICNPSYHLTIFNSNNSLSDTINYFVRLESISPCSKVRNISNTIYNSILDWRWLYLRITLTSTSIKYSLTNDLSNLGLIKWLLRLNYY